MCKRMMASVVMAAAIFMSTSYTQAGMVGHVSAVPIGPALRYTTSGDADAVGVGRVQVQPTFAGQTQAEREWALQRSVNPESGVGLKAPAKETGSLPADDAKHAKQLKSKGASEGAASQKTPPPEPPPVVGN